MDQRHTADSALEPTIGALYQLSPQSQETIASLVRQLAQRENQRTTNGILRSPSPTEIR